MRLLCVMVMFAGLGLDTARAAPTFDGNDLAALDKVVPALVADKQDCAKVATHAAAVAGAFGKLAGANPKTPNLVTVDVSARVLAHAVAVQGALATACLPTLDKKLVTRVATALVKGVGATRGIRVRQSPDIHERDYNAPPQPKPIPAEDQQLVGLLEFYLRVADAGDADRPGMMFLRANVLRRYNHFDKAIPIFLEIIDKHPKHETAEYAANLALDSYNRLQKYEELIALAKKLRDTPGFLDKREDLRDVVGKILRQADRRGAESCERAASQTKDRVKLGKCAEQYVAMYNANPSDPSNDENLYNAAVLFDQAGSAGAAIQMLRILKTKFPSSKLNARGLGRIGNLYQRIGMYADAATALEEYATKYAGEKDAHMALSDAMLYRRALGDRAKAVENALAYQRFFGVKKPVEAAEAQLAIVVMFEDAGDDAELAKQAATYLQRYGKRDPRGTIAVQSAIARSAWRRSCPVALHDGLCLEYDRARPLRGQPARPATSCGPSALKLRAVARKPALVEEARKAFQAAIALADRNGAPESQSLAVAARIALADLELEAGLALRAPTDPKALGKWLADKRAKHDAAIQQYAAIASKPAGAVEGTARGALAQQLFAESMLAAEIPPAIRNKADVVDTYCDQLTAAVEPVLKQAVTAYGTCIATARDANVVSASSRSCQRGLAELDPSRAISIVEPVLAPSVIRVPVQLEPALSKVSPLFDEFRKLEGKWTTAQCDRLGKQLMAASNKDASVASGRAGDTKDADRGAMAFMAGLAYHRCNNIAEATRAYQHAGTYGPALSNLGAIAAANQRTAAARKLWTDALKADGKLVAARVNIAALQLDELRALSPTDAAWKKLAEDIQYSLSSALAVSEDDIAARVAFAALYFEGPERLARTRAEVGRLALQAIEGNAVKSPLLENTIAVYEWRKGRTTAAFDRWKSVAASDAGAAMNVALSALAIGKYADAKTQLAAAKPAPSLAYERSIALGVAHRALGDGKSAEAAYQQAIGLAATRPEAYFALGVLHEQTATRTSDLTAATAAYKRAAEQYRKAADRATGSLKANAQASAAEADRAIAAIGAFQKP